MAGFAESRKGKQLAMQMWHFLYLAGALQQDLVSLLSDVLFCCSIDWCLLMLDHQSAMLELSHGLLRSTDYHHATHSSVVCVTSEWEESCLTEALLTVAFKQRASTTLIPLKVKICSWGNRCAKRYLFSKMPYVFIYPSLFIYPPPNIYTFIYPFKIRDCQWLSAVQPLKQNILMWGP